MDPIRSIVVPTDFSELAQAATARAVTLARLDGASIHLVHALNMPLVTPPLAAPVPEAVWQDLRKAADDSLAEEREAIEGKGVGTVTAEAAEMSEAVHLIARAVEVHAADLVVMGTHGRSGFKHAFLGSVAERTLRTIDCPVLAVKESLAKARQPITRILVAVDFSVHSDRAVDVAASLAGSLDASLDFIHAFELPRDYVQYSSPFAVEFAQQIQANSAERLDRVRERVEEGLTVTLHSRRGYPSVAIAEVAEEIGCQLIVMGTRGIGGLSHVLLGSVAERTLRTAPCGVLAVKAQQSDSE